MGSFRSCRLYCVGLILTAGVTTGISNFHSWATDVSYHGQASLQEFCRFEVRTDSYLILEKAKAESELTFMGILAEASCWPKRMAVGHFCQKKTKTVHLFS